VSRHICDRVINQRAQRVRLWQRANIRISDRFFCDAAGFGAGAGGHGDGAWTRGKPASV